MNMENLEKKIMGEIESGRVTVRSRYLFMAEKLGLGSAMVLTVVLGSLFVALVLWYMKNSETLSYLSFGSDGILAFWESFPYGLLVSSIIIFLLIAYLFKKSGWVYKIPFGFIILALIACLSIIGIALNFTTLPGQISRQEIGPAKPLFRSILPNQKMGKGGMVGKMAVWEDPRGMVLTPHGLRPINAEYAPENERKSITVGVTVMMVGRPEEGIFIVRHIRIIPKDRLPQRMLQ